MPKAAKAPGIPLFKVLCFTIIANALIATLLTLANLGADSFNHFIFAQCIGISICLCVGILYPRFSTKNSVFRSVASIATVLVATLIGLFVAIFILMDNPMAFIQHAGRLWIIQILFLGLFFGIIGTYVFSSNVQLLRAEARIQEERIKRLNCEKSLYEMCLKQLQAQMEPHFLFNTLSTILSLLELDTPKGKSMLLDFVNYLRSSLTRIREDHNTIGLEFDMIRSYLNLFKVRMDERLHFQIHLPSELEMKPIPPMLIQPLVENALKHGLEPKIEGGSIHLTASQHDDMLKIEISDTGVGITSGSPAGLGLKNIRERLQALFDDSARLSIQENHPSGITAVIEVPDNTHFIKNSR